MSTQTKEANQAWLNDLWDVYRTTVAETGNLTINDVAPNAKLLIERFTQVKGDLLTMQPNLVLLIKF